MFEDCAVFLHVFFCFYNSRLGNEKGTLLKLVKDYILDFMKICRDAQPRVLQIKYTKKEKKERS